MHHTVMYACFCSSLIMQHPALSWFLLTKQIHCIYLNFKRLCLSSLKKNFHYTNGYHLLTTSQHRTFSSLCPVIYLQPLMFDDFFFVMLILKVSLQRSVTAVSHKETNRRDYLDLLKFLSRICGYFFTKFFLLLLLLNDSLFKREKKDSGFFFQVAA